MNLPERPALMAHVHVEVVDSTLVVLVPGGRESYFFDGAIYTRIAPLLDGHRTVPELLNALDDSVSITKLYYVLYRLAGHGLLTDGRWQDDMDVAWRHGLGLAMGRHGCVAIHAECARDTAMVGEALANYTNLTDRDESADLHLVITDHYLEPRLRARNREVLTTSAAPWLLLRPGGHQSWMGPIFHPGKNGCWECLAERIRLNHQLEDFIVRHQDHDGLPHTYRTSRAISRSVVAEWAALEIARWLAGDPFLEQYLLAIDSVRLEVTQHAFVQRPQCPACGNPDLLGQRSKVTLQPQRKRFISDGGHRVCTPQETFAAYQHHVSPITGVVRWLIDTTADDDDLTFSFIAGHNFAMGRDTVSWLGESLRSRTGGKGQTRIQAQVSALGEAVERYSGVYRGDEAGLRASYRELDGAAIHLYDCLHFSAAQYRDRERINRHKNGTFHFVPNPFDDDLEIEWTPVWSLSKQEVRYVPAAYCYYGHPDSQSHFFCGGDSNGCAAGNSFEEASLQAFFELVERDAVAIWWYNRLSCPGVELDTFEDASYVARLRRYYAERDREFWVIDVTSDLGIPCFAAVSARIDRGAEDIIVGFGAHLDPRIALLRAVTELNQFLPAVSSRRADGSTIYQWPEDEAIRFWQNERIVDHPWLAPDPARTQLRREDYPTLYTDNLLDDLELCRGRVEAAGMEMLILDQTRPDIGMNVCRIIVPGMRHFWRRLAPGRLYEVPVAQGRLERARSEDELNPYSVFI